MGYRTSAKTTTNDAPERDDGPSPAWGHQLWAQWLLARAREVPEGRHLALDGPSPGTVAALARSPALRKIESLTITNLGHDMLGPLLDSPHVNRLGKLEVREAKGRVDVIGQLSRARGLSALENLHICGRKPDRTPIDRLGEAEQFVALRTLALVGLQLEADQIDALLRGRALRAIEHLYLDVFTAGSVLWPIARLLPALRSLRVTQSGGSREVDPASLAAIAALPHLESLELSNCRLGQAHADALASRPMPALRALDLRGNDLHGSHGLATLMSSVCPQLACLGLTIAHPETARLLGSSSHAELRHLRLNAMAPETLDSAWTGPFPRLEVIDLRCSHGFGAKDLGTLLAELARFPRLQLIDLTHTGVSPGEARGIGQSLGWRVVRTFWMSGLWLLRERAGSDGVREPTSQTDRRATLCAMHTQERMLDGERPLLALARSESLDPCPKVATTSNVGLAVRRYSRHALLVGMAIFALVSAGSGLFMRAPGSSGPRAPTAAEQAAAAIVADLAPDSRLLFDPLRLVSDGDAGQVFFRLLFGVGLAGLFLAMLWRSLDERWRDTPREAGFWWLLLCVSLVLGTGQCSSSLDVGSRTVVRQATVLRHVPVLRLSCRVQDDAQATIAEDFEEDDDGDYETVGWEIRVGPCDGKHVEVAYVSGGTYGAKLSAGTMAVVVRDLLAGRLPGDRSAPTTD